MGPQNCASVPSKDLSWIDLMYMKFETMCVEVDKKPSLLLQETSKYVESQVNAVGANVKKLCSELIQDLISAPMLSSEGGEKKLDCALHCKCHCMDSEKSKLLGLGTAGAVGGEDNLNDNDLEKHFSLKKNLYKVDTVSVDSVLKPQTPKLSGLCGPEVSNVQEHVQSSKKGWNSNTAVAVEALEIGGTGRYAEGIVGSTIQQGDHCGKIEMSCIETRKEERKFTILRDMEAAISRCESAFLEQASIQGDDDDKEPGRTKVTLWNSCAETALGSPEDNWQPQHEKETKRTVSPASDINLQSVIDRDIGLSLNTDANDARGKYDCFFSAKGLQAEEVKRVGDGFWPMYSHYFSEPTRSIEVDDSIIVSDRDSEEFYDEEQSAHWFAGQDVRTAFQPETFSEEACPHEGDSDFDWELL